MGKLTKRQQLALGLAASIQNIAGMRIPGDERDAIARLAIIEIDAERICNLLSMTTDEALRSDVAALLAQARP